ncbi:hypothetical protein D6C98_07341 [Aureobasidium pullulans]|nr:hypothetical protein D6C98_07341 [Aureobasidium pullulans]
MEPVATEDDFFRRKTSYTDSQTHKVLIMKLSFFLLTIAISGVMMSPTINKRQNDVQNCVKGQGDMKGKAYDGPVNNCKKECFLNEGPDQPNAGLLCKGYCRVVGHPAPISECRGEYSVHSWISVTRLTKAQHRFLAVSRFIVWVVALTTTKIMGCQAGAIVTPSYFPCMR